MITSWKVTSFGFCVMFGVPDAKSLKKGILFLLSAMHPI